MHRPIESSQWLVQRTQLRTKASEFERALDFIEVCLLILLFASLALKGAYGSRDWRYEYLGGFILFAFTFLRYNTKIFRISKTIFFYLIFAFVASLTIFWAHDRFLAFEEFQKIAASIPIMVAIHNICRTERGIKRVLFALKLVLVVSVFAVVVTGQYSRFERQFFGLSSSGVAPFMLMSFAAIFLEWNIRRKCYTCALAVIACLIPLILVSSVRSIVVILAIVIVFFLARHLTTKRGWILLAGTLVALFGMAMYFSSFLQSALEGTRYFRHYSHMASYFDEGTVEGSVGFRILAIGLSVDMIRERPIIGHGVDNSRYLFEKKVGFVTYSHNGYLEILIGMGFIGLFFFMLIFSETVWRFVRQRKMNNRVAAAGLSIVAGFLLFNAMGTVYKTTELLIVIALLASGGMWKLLENPPRSSV